MTIAPPEVDLLVIGGGPAGATLATLVSLAGHRVLLLEQERFPRYQVGESLVPATIHGICPLLGVSQEVASAGFVKRRGGVVQPGPGEAPWIFHYVGSGSMTPDTAFGYQVERSRFDYILLANARRKGVVVYEQARVSEVLRAGGRAAGARWADASGRMHTIAARYVADASGFGSQLHGEVGERALSRASDNVMLHGYYRLRRELPERERIGTHFTAFDGGWFWCSPLSDELMSVGVIAEPQHAAQIRSDPLSAMERFIQACPRMSELLGDASLAAEAPYGTLRICSGYAYSNTRFWSRGMLLVGDSACAVDPIFSSGVHLGTYAALLAARSVNSCLAHSLEETESFLEFEMRYRREHASQQEHSRLPALLRAEGDKGAVRGDLVDLVAGLAVSGEPLFASERDLSEARASGRNCFRGALRACDDFEAAKYDQFLGDGHVRHSARLQVQHVVAAARAGRAGRDAALIPSADGLHWCARPS